MTQYYSRSDTVYSGSATVSIPFSYIKKEDISAVIIREVEGIETEIEASFTWSNASQITITTTLQTGDIISVRRNTPVTEKIVTYQNESMILDEDNLNLSQDQLLNAVQEMRDGNVTFQLDIDEAFEDYKDEIEDSFDSYKETVDSEIEAIDGKADSAISTADSADSKAGSAVATATSAFDTAYSAMVSATEATLVSGSAVVSATEATLVSGSAMASATSALETATSASNKVDSFGDDIAVVISAADKINELQEAVTTATQAATTATTAAQTATSASQTATSAAQAATEAVASIEQSDWDETVTTSKAYIRNKPTIPNVTSTYSSSGTDAVNGTAVSSALTPYQLLSRPLVNIGLAHGSVSLTNNAEHKIIANGNVTFSLPTGSSTTFGEILVELYMASVYTINLGATVYFNGIAPDMSSAGYYTIIYEYDSIRDEWVVGALKKA